MPTGRTEEARPLTLLTIPSSLPSSNPAILADHLVPAAPTHTSFLTSAGSKTTLCWRTEAPNTSEKNLVETPSLPKPS